MMFRFICCLAVFVVLGLGCRSRQNSEGKFVKLVSSDGSKSQVIYKKGKSVILRTCSGAGTNLTKDCPTNVDEIPLDEDTYFELLPLDYGGYDRSKEGLDELRRAKQSAKENASASEKAADAYSKLKLYDWDLELALRIEREFESPEGETYYEWNELFTLLAGPFNKQIVFVENQSSGEVFQVDRLANAANHSLIVLTIDSSACLKLRNQLKSKYGDCPVYYFFPPGRKTKNPQLYSTESAYSLRNVSFPQYHEKQGGKNFQWVPTYYVVNQKGQHVFSNSGFPITPTVKPYCGLGNIPPDPN